MSPVIERHMLPELLPVLIEPMDNPHTTGERFPEYIARLIKGPMNLPRRTTYLFYNSRRLGLSSVAPVNSRRKLVELRGGGLRRRISKS